MTFQPNIPQPADLISVSQNDLLQNFQAIGTGFDVNHVDFNAAGAGKHKFVELPVQGSNPVTVAGETTIFSKTQAGNSEVFIKQDAGPGTTYQLTYGQPGTGTANSNSFLPGQYLIAWGRSAVTNGATVTIPSFTTTYEVTLTVEDAGGGLGGIANIKSVGAGNFVVNTNGALVIRWIAIGN